MTGGCWGIGGRRKTGRIGADRWNRFQKSTATTMECFDRIRSTVSTIVRDGMDLEAAPSASSDPRLSIRHAFLAARRTKRSRNWLQPRYECPPSPSTPVHRGTPRFVRAFPISSLRQRFFPKFIHLYIYTRILSRSRYGSRQILDR